MKNNHETIEYYINKAHELGNNKRLDEAVECFFAIRALLRTSSTNNQSAQDILEKWNRHYENEAKKFQNIVIQANQKDMKNNETIIIIGDSLQLPRPDETKHDDFGLSRTCSFFLQSLIKEERMPFFVSTWAQRFYTTNSILTNWDTILGNNLEHAHIVIHVGLNDHVERIFLEKDRLGMDLYPEELKMKIVKFGQIFRKHIINRQLNYAYVPFEKFQENVYEIINRLKSKNAKSITFVNIISLPSASWDHTPRAMWNTTRYNMFLYDVALKHKINLIDIDRLVWEDGLHENMLSDKMHLSLKGHAKLAKSIFQSIKEKS